jgi:hypothetical protein
MWIKILWLYCEGLWVGELIQPRGTRGTRGISQILFFPVLFVVTFSLLFQGFLNRQRDLLALRFFSG